ncbi:CHRD domain-containing protein [Enterovibrio sp. Hal110]
MLFTFPIDGSQEVPVVTTSAQGNGYALLNTETGALTLKAVTEGVSGATAAHIHNGVSVRMAVCLWGSSKTVVM